MFERFSDRARRVVVLSQEEAQLLSHDYIGTEHILLGLLHEGEGVAARALRSLGISLEAARRQVEEIVGEGGSSPSGHIPFTPRAKKVLELSLREALQLGHNYIGTEHILLGLVREGEGVACQALVKLGASLPTVRARVLQLVADGTVEGAAGRMRLSPELVAVLDEARRAAEAKGEAQVMPVHLFLAADEHPDGAAARMLRVVGIDRDELRRRLADESDDAPDDESG
jgi:ATP-dependent Clp protease ATP-binding subunit ClpC